MPLADEVTTKDEKPGEVVAHATKIDDPILVPPGSPNDLIYC